MKLLICLTLLLSSISSADVRVYQYLVLNTVETTPNPTEQIVTSTLNPIAFMAYHGGEKIVNVDLLRTWMCFGHTGSKKLCPPPMSKLDAGVLP